MSGLPEFKFQINGFGIGSIKSCMFASKSNSFFSDAFGTLAMRTVGVALTFVSTPVIARLLGPLEFGAYSAAVALASLLTALAPLGSERILVRNVSATKSPDDVARETAIAHLCTGIVTAVLVAGLLAAWGLSGLVTENTGWARTALLAVVIFVPRTVLSLRQWLAIPIIGSRRAVMPELTILPLLFTSSLLLLTTAGLKLTAANAAIASGAMVVVIWVGALQTSAIRVVYSSAWKVARHATRTEILQQYRNGIPFVSVGIGAVLTQSCMPIVIAATCGFKEAAFFTLAFSCAGLATLALPAFNLSMIPRCARFYKFGDFAGAQHAVRSAATATFALAVALSIAMWICSPLLTTLLGTDYSMVRRLLPALLLSMIVDCLTGPTNPVLQTMQMEKTHSRTLLAFIPIQFGLVFLLGETVGVEGAAFAFLVSRCLWNIVIFTRIYQVLGLIMLPYFGFMNAFRIPPPMPDCEMLKDKPEQSRWRVESSSATSLSQVKAA